jgi:hypothetical protein
MASVIFHSRPRKPQFTIAEAMGLISGVAGGLVWPPLMMASLDVALVVLLHRAGLKWLAAMIIVFVLNFALGLFIR